MSELNRLGLGLMICAIWAVLLPETARGLSIPLSAISLSVGFFMLSHEEKV